METKDILENQPWSLIEDQLEDQIEINDDTDTIDDNDDKEPVKVKEKPPASSNDNPFKFLAEDLGLNLPDDWNGDADEFKELLIEDAKNALVSNFDDPVVSGFINYVSNGGKAVEFLQALQTPAVDRMSPEDIYRSYMKMTTNFSDEKINKLMERSKDTGDFDSEVAEYKDEINAAQDEHIQEVLRQQEEEKKKRAIAQKQAQEYRKKLAKSRDIMGVPISRNSEFERFYLTPTERMEYDGKQYMVTAYQKRLMERQKDPVQYEALMAYLEFTNFKGLPNNVEATKEKATGGLKDKLSSYYGATRNGPVTRLIDES